MKHTLISLALLCCALAGRAQAPSGVEAVDLGLPSGTKWASMNVGATTANGKGLPFAWAEIETKGEFTKYNQLWYNWTADVVKTPNGDISGRVYDAAHVRWGGKWRMPRKTEFEELLQQCTRKSEVLDGVVGLRLTGPNGHSIFLPYDYTRWQWEAEYWSATSVPGLDGRAYAFSHSYGAAWLSTLSNYNFAEDGKYIRPVMDETTEVDDFNLIDVDEEQGIAPVKQSGIIRLTKTFHHGWNTLALPFELSGTRLTTLFSFNSYQLYTFQGYSKGAFNFKRTTSLRAHTPYLLYYSGPTERVVKFFGQGRGGGVGISEGTPVKQADNYAFTGVYETADGSATPADYMLAKRTFERPLAGGNAAPLTAYIKSLDPANVDNGSPVYIATDGTRIDPCLLLDENSTELPDAGDGEENLRVVLTLAANAWNTIALPFSMTASQARSAFGSGVELACFTGYEADDDAEHLTVDFARVDLDASGMAANTPYIIKPTNDVQEFSVTATMELHDSRAMTSFFADGTDGQEPRYGAFIGIFRASPLDAERSLLLENGLFRYPDDDATFPAFHAYLDLKHVLANRAEARNHIALVLDGVTVDIPTLLHQPQTAPRAFDLQGRPIARHHRGLRIVEGKKYIGR